MGAPAAPQPSLGSPGDGTAAADLVLRGGTVLTLDAHSQVTQALAVREGRIVAAGDDAEMQRHIGPRTQVVELGGRTLMPGLVDAHAHLDREALKSFWPSVSGCASIADLVGRLRDLAAQTPRGRWITTLPIGEPPDYRWHEGMYADGRLPDRHDLDRASREHPIYIRCPWGYWPDALPLVSIANTRALELAGVGPGTPSPSPRLRIENAADGSPTGRFFEDQLQPLAEFTLFRQAPNFTADDRLRTLRASMQAYNAAGTTSVFEGHGVADEVIHAYEQVAREGSASVRAHLVFSPGWTGASDADVQRWVHDQARRLDPYAHDPWLRLGGLFAQPDPFPEDSALRAACAPVTGWAGFRYDCGLPPDRLERLLLAAAREGLRVCAIQHRMADLFIRVGEQVPIAGLRWVIAHPSVLTPAQIEGLARHGIGITTLTSWYHWRKASATLAQVGKEQENSISPLRSLLQAGVPVALASDNFPVSLWPAIWQAVARTDRQTGEVVAPAQCLSVEQALRCATTHGAWVCQREREIGTLEPGKWADFIVLADNPLTMPPAALSGVSPLATYAGGRLVWERTGKSA